MAPIQGVLALLVLASLLLSAVVLARLHAGRRWGDVLRERFVLGVPWGTVLVLAGVLAVYLFVQDGWNDFQNPVSLPFRAWSYYYPLGILTSSFTHADDGHLLNNLFSAALLAPLAEYAWGHYPTGRDGHETTSWWTTPWIRAVVVFPLGIVVVGVMTAAFGLGPVIGFSGVVFAMAGFAIVRYPISTIVAVLGGQTALWTIYRAIWSPVFEYTARSSPPSAPSWATTAIQGHAIGFLVGFCCCLILCRNRSYRPDPLRLWLAVVLFGFAQGLWAIYWFGGQNTYLLFRGPGVLVVLVLALVVTLAVADDAPPIGGDLAIRVDWPANETVERVRASVPPRHTVAVAAVVLVLVAITVPAIPVNLFVADDASAGDGSVAVEDYTVYYAENVENELVSFVDVSLFGQDTQLEASGVIVTSEQRSIWSEAVSAQQLAHTGYETIHVGGPGWREAVSVSREGWTPVENDTVYRVELWTDGEDPRLAYESASSRADVRIDGRNVTLLPAGGGFSFAVESNGSVQTVPIPEDGESATVDDLTFERDGDVVYAKTNDTELVVATRETYD